MKREILLEDGEANAQMSMLLDRDGYGVVCAGTPDYTNFVFNEVKYARSDGLPWGDDGKCWRFTTYYGILSALDKFLTLSITMEKAVIRGLRFYNKEIQRIKKLEIKRELSEQESQQLIIGLARVIGDAQKSLEMRLKPIES